MFDRLSSQRKIVQGDIVDNREIFSITFFGYFSHAIKNKTNIYVYFGKIKCSQLLSNNRITHSSVCKHNISISVGNLESIYSVVIFQWRHASLWVTVQRGTFHFPLEKNSKNIFFQHLFFYLEVDI